MALRLFRGIVSKTGPSLALQEVLYGFIMALIFVTAARVGLLDFAGKWQLIALIIGMNLTWGAIDAVIFYLLGVFDQRKFSRVMRDSSGDEESRVDELVDAFSGTPLDLLEPECERAVCREILRRNLESEEEMHADRRAMRDSSVACFVITALTIIPVTLPIALASDTATGLMMSSVISSMVLFFVGYAMEEYVGVNRWVLGLFLAGMSWAITIVATFTGG